MNIKTEDVITCKVCGHIDPLTKKFKCSQCGAKNWGHQLPTKSDNGCLWQILTFIIILAGYLIYDNVKKYGNNHWSQAEIENSFSKNVVLVYHEFVYELKFDDPEEGSLYFIRKDDGGFTQWQKGMHPNAVSGCGFITNADGTCITTHNLTQPWLSDWDMIQLKKEVQIFRGPPFNIRSGGQYQLFTIKFGYYNQGTKINDPVAFNPCRVTGSWDKEIEVMSVQQLNNAASVKTAFQHTYTLPDLKKDDELYLIGYPIQISKSENLHPLITTNKIDSAGPKELHFAVTSLFTLEGAPVFSKQGNLVGLTTIDEKGQVKAMRTNFERVKSD